jgi:hypothetical protein
MIPTRSAGGEHVRLLAVPPAVTAPNADPRLAADAAPSAALLRAAASGSIAPRAHRAVAQPTPVVMRGDAPPAIAQPGVLVLGAPVLRTEQVHTKAAVAARVVEGQSVATVIVPDPQRGPAAAVLPGKRAAPSGARSANANPAMPDSAEQNAPVHRVALPAQPMADEPLAVSNAARGVRPAQALTRSMPDAAPAKAARFARRHAAEAKVVRNADHDAPFLRPAIRLALAKAEHPL